MESVETYQTSEMKHLVSELLSDETGGVDLDKFLEPSIDGKLPDRLNLIEANIVCNSIHFLNDNFRTHILPECMTGMFLKKDNVHRRKVHQEIDEVILFINSLTDSVMTSYRNELGY